MFRSVPGGHPTTLGYPLPTAPGLGVEIDEEALREFEVDYQFSGVNYLRKVRPPHPRGGLRIPAS